MSLDWEKIRKANKEFLDTIDFEKIINIQSDNIETIRDLMNCVELHLAAEHIKVPDEIGCEVFDTYDEYDLLDYLYNRYPEHFRWSEKISYIIEWE